MRLIDADAFLEENKVFADRDFDHPMYEDTLRDLVDAAPTVDAVPVVHGRWVRIGEADYKCSICGFRFTSGEPISMFSHCRCGAKMDGEKAGEV